MAASFEWDFDKDAQNQQKHGVSFSLAQEAFLARHRPGHCAQQVRRALLLFWFSGRRSSNRAIHLSERCDSHHWRGILAQGQANL